MTVQAKFTVHNVNRSHNPSTGVTESIEVILRPVYGDSPENKTWSKWTPSGELRMTITNPEVFDVFKPGTPYFIDVSAAQ